MSISYHLTEAYPKAPTPFAHTGRGGAGNIGLARPTLDRPPHQYSTNAASLPDGPDTYPPPPGLAAITAAKSRRRKFVSGRGGFGNLHPASESTIFSFDEELERIMHAEDTLAPIYHVGRGGSGNLIDNRDTLDTESRSYESVSSTDSQFSLKGSLERMWNHFGTRRR